MNNLPLFDKFITYLKTNNYSVETISNYEHDLNCLNSFIDVALDQVTKSGVETYKDYLVTQGLQPNSINRYLSSLRGYLKFLNFSDYKVLLQPDQIQMIKTEQKIYKLAELDELIKLIESPIKLEKDKYIGTRNRAILEIFFSTGMRISELVSLNRGDIKPSGEAIIMGKGKKERVVYVTERALVHLQNYLDARTDASEALFVPKKGNSGRISTNYIQERIKAYREALGIGIKTSAHSLRHGFATYLSENGASSVAIQMLLGHASPNTTARYINASQKFAAENHQKFHPLNI